MKFKQINNNIIIMDKQFLSAYVLLVCLLTQSIIILFIVIGGYN